MCGRTRSGRSGTRVIDLGVIYLLLPPHHHLARSALSVLSIVRISTSGAYFGNLRLVVIISGLKINPMTVSVPYDLALAVYRVGMMSRLHPDFTSPDNSPRFSQIALSLCLRLASPHLLLLSNLKPSPESRLVVCIPLGPASIFDRVQFQSQPWIYTHLERGQLCKRFRRDI